MKSTAVASALCLALVTLFALDVAICPGQEQQPPAVVLQRIAARDHYRTVHSLAWSPDSELLVSGSADFRTSLWTIPELEKARWLSRRRGSVYSVAFSPSGSLIASADHHGHVCVYSSDSGELRHEIDSGREAVTSMTFLGDDDRLLIGHKDGQVQLWSPSETRLLERLDCTATIVTIAYSARDQRIAASVFRRAARGISESSGVLLWEYSDDTFSELPGMNVDSSSVSALHFSATGKLLASGGWSRRIRIWDTRTRESVLELEGHRVSTTSVCFSPDEQLLASTGQDAFVRLWSVSTGKLISEHEPFSHGVGRCIRFSPDGKYLVAGGGYEPGEIVLWSVVNSADDDRSAPR